MELPETVKIGGARWTLVGDADAANRLKEDSLYGTMLESKQIIRIDTTNTEAKVAESLLHELIHAIQCAYITPGDRTEERFVKTFTAGLFQVLRDNPDVVAFILARK